LLPTGVDADLSIRAIIAPITIMMAMFAPDIMAVNPMMTVLRPMARHPHHFPFATPVARAMAVIGTVTEFDSKSLRLNGTPESETRNADRYE
jgi:hypothetical protein